MPLAELVVHHSRPVAPTRRVALGDAHLPVTPPPGFGGILLGGIVAANAPRLDEEAQEGLLTLTEELEAGHSIAQPRLRHRLQYDRIGLTTSRMVLVGDGETMRLELEDKAAPAQYCLAAVYAAGRLERPARGAVMDTVRKGIRWRGSVGPQLIGHLSGVARPSVINAEAFEDPVGWARGVLGIDGRTAEDRAQVQRRFRALLRDAHPDHGGAQSDAAARIADLAAAREILLAGV